MRSKLGYIRKLVLIASVAVGLAGILEGNRSWHEFKEWGQEVLDCLVKSSVWPQDASDIEVDKRIHFGQLKNGLRYAVMKNGEPPMKVSMRLLVRSGSLMEEETQRGLAHFLEHMAFNGSKSFSKGEFIEYFQRIGMEFGPDTNAHTAFNETVYKLDLPDIKHDTMGTGLKVLREIGDSLLLDKGALESERGVVYSELRDGLSPERRLLEAQWGFFLKGSLIPKRLPIGLEDVVLHAPRERMEAFYKKWYTADRMVVVVVGDVEAGDVEKLIEEQFGSMEKGTHLEFPDMGKVNVKEMTAEVYKDKELSKTGVEIMVVRNAAEPFKDSKAFRIKEMRRKIAYAIFTKRLNILEKAENAPFYELNASYMDFLQKYELNAVGFSCQAGDWRKALGVAEYEIRRAMKFGFTEAEFVEATRNLISNLEQAARGEPSMKNKVLANSVVDVLSNDSVYTDGSYDLKLGEEAMKGFSKEDCHNVFKAEWEGQHALIFVSGTEELDATKKDVLELYKENEKVVVSAPKEEIVQDFAYKNFGKAGTYEKEGEDKELGLSEYKFGNNVRLTLMPTEYEKGSVSVAVNFGAGHQNFTESNAGINKVAGTVYIGGGLELHKASELDSIFAGKTMHYGFESNNHLFTFYGVTTEKDLGDELRVLAAYMKHPGLRETEFAMQGKQFEDFYNQLYKTPVGVARSSMDKYLGNNYWEFGFPNKETVMKISPEDVKTWMGDALNKGYIEVMIVGDFKIEEALKAVAETFGAMEEREATRDLSLVEGVDFPESHEMKEFYVDSDIPKGIATVVWKTGDFFEMETSRKLSLLGEIFSDRLRLEIRAKLGSSYSPYAYNNPSKIYKGYGRFMAVAQIAPEQAETVDNIMVDIGQDLANGNISEDEFERAIKPLLEGIKKEERTNNYWINQLGEVQARPEMLALVKDRFKMYEGFTLEDIKKVAREYLGADKAYRIAIVPSSYEKKDDTGSEEVVGAGSEAVL